MPKDPEFGAKLDHVAGIIGHRYHSLKFQQKRLASELEINASTFTHMRAGNRDVSEDTLARVVAAFGLHRYGVTYEDFLLSLDQFKLSMREKRVGLFGDLTAEQASQRLMQKALEEAGSSEGLKVSVLKAEGVRRGGGFGDDRSALAKKCTFKVGEYGLISIRVPNDGNLLVLNDEIGIGLTALLPTAADPRAYHQRGEIVLPDPETDQAYPIGAPTVYSNKPSPYRIFVIWSSAPTAMHSLLSEHQGSRPAQVSYFELANLISDLEIAEQTNWRAASCEYLVEV